jgi:hypothetical protein
MTRYTFLFCLFALARIADVANGHSNPIDLSAVGGPMGDVVVSGGIADTGYAPMIFADGTLEAQLEHLDVPGYGQVAMTDIPGFILRSSFPEHTIFNMQIIPRPVQGTNPVEERVLWHWSAASQSVALAPNSESLVILSPYDEITLRQTPPGPREVFVTHLEPFDMDQHVHFLRYLLDNSPTAATGAYGFFARFLVAPYQNPDPILVVLNNGLDEATLLTAARAINAAAADSVSLQGDFNSSGTVDAADYVLWRKGAAVPTTPQNYAMWRTNFDMSGGAATATSATAAVPEPACSWLLICAILWALTARNSPNSIDSLRASP